MTKIEVRDSKITMEESKSRILARSGFPATDRFFVPALVIMEIAEKVRRRPTLLIRLRGPLQHKDLFETAWKTMIEGYGRRLLQRLLYSRDIKSVLDVRKSEQDSWDRTIACANIS